MLTSCTRLCVPQDARHLGQAQSDTAVDAAAEQQRDAQRRGIWLAPCGSRETVSCRLGPMLTAGCSVCFAVEAAVLVTRGVLALDYEIDQCFNRSPAQ